MKTMIDTFPFNPEMYCPAAYEIDTTAYDSATVTIKADMFIISPYFPTIWHLLNEK